MKVIKFWKIIGSFYKSEKKADTLIVVAIWAPNLMDVDNLRNAKILTDAWYDVITPEYYWFCRSWWKFTPKNSIKTLLDTKNFFKNWELLDVYSWEKFSVSYKKFIFLGLSYWWWAVPLLPKFDKEIKNIAMFYPVVDYFSFWKRWVKEETVEDFCDSIVRWFSKIYKSIKSPIWKKHFEDKTDLIPVKNLDLMEWVNLFLCHWTEDKSIYYKKTSEYFEKLKEKFPSWNFEYKEYKGFWHGWETLIKWSEEMVKFFEENF